MHSPKAPDPPLSNRRAGTWHKRTDLSGSRHDQDQRRRPALGSILTRNKESPGRAGASS